MDSEYVESRISRRLHSLAAKEHIPLSGTFELTPCCNLSCKMCYVRKSMAEVSAMGGLIRADRWIAIAEKARSMGLLYLLLTGGEPLSHPEFKKIYTAVRNMGIVVSINTNGTLIDEDMVAFFAANPPARINMTLYGASRETYGALCGVPEAYDRAVWALGALKAAGITVKLNYSVTRYNCGDMQSVLETARRHEAHMQTTCYMFPPLRRDENSVGENDRLSPEEDARYTLQNELHGLGREEFLKRAEARLRRFPGTVAEQEECLDAPTEHIGCRAGKTAFWINWNGDASPCGMMPLGAANVFEDGFEKAWEATRRMTAEILLPPECTACPDRPVCIMCAASCYCETGSFDKVPRYLCRRTGAMLAETQKQVQRLRAQEEKDES